MSFNANIDKLIGGMAEDAFEHWKAIYGPQAAVLQELGITAYQEKVLPALQEDAEFKALAAKVTAETSIVQLAKVLYPIIERVATGLLL